MSVPEADYKKLASHYARTKKEHGVLKKAVLAEQAKSAQVEAEKEEADKKLRGAVEEIDRQGYENERLKARIKQMRVQMDNIEEDVRANAAGGGSMLGRFLGSGTSDEVSKLRDEVKVMRADLDVKIKENERVHMEQFELRTGFETEVQKLKDSLKAMTKKSRKLNGIAKERGERIEALEASLRQQVGRAEQAEADLARSRAGHRGLQGTLGALRAHVAYALPVLDDTRDSALSARYSLPPHSAVAARRLDELGEAAVAALGKLGDRWHSQASSRRDLLQLESSSSSSAAVAAIAEWRSSLTRALGQVHTVPQGLRNIYGAVSALLDGHRASQRRAAQSAGGGSGSSTSGSGIGSLRGGDSDLGGGGGKGSSATSGGAAAAADDSYRHLCHGLDALVTASREAASAEIALLNHETPPPPTPPPPPPPQEEEARSSGEGGDEGDDRDDHDDVKARLGIGRLLEALGSHVTDIDCDDANDIVGAAGAGATHGADGVVGSGGSSSSSSSSNSSSSGGGGGGGSGGGKAATAGSSTATINRAGDGLRAHNLALAKAALGQYHSIVRLARGLTRWLANSNGTDGTDDGRSGRGSGSSSSSSSSSSETGSSAQVAVVTVLRSCEALASWLGQTALQLQSKHMLLAQLAKQQQQQQQQQREEEEFGGDGGAGEVGAVLGSVWQASAVQRAGRRLTADAQAVAAACAELHASLTALADLRGRCSVTSVGYLCLPRASQRAAFAEGGAGEDAVRRRRRRQDTKMHGQLAGRARAYGAFVGRVALGKAISYRQAAQGQEALAAAERSLRQRDADLKRERAQLAQVAQTNQRQKKELDRLERALAAAVAKAAAATTAAAAAAAGVGNGTSSSGHDHDVAGGNGGAGDDEGSRGGAPADDTGRGGGGDGASALSAAAGMGRSGGADRGDAYDGANDAMGPQTPSSSALLLANVLAADGASGRVDDSPAPLRPGAASGGGKLLAAGGASPLGTSVGALAAAMGGAGSVGDEVGLLLQGDGSGRGGGGGGGGGAVAADDDNYDADDFLEGEAEGTDEWFWGGHGGHGRADSGYGGDGGDGDDDDELSREVLYSLVVRSDDSSRGAAAEAAAMAAAAGAGSGTSGTAMMTTTTAAATAATATAAAATVRLDGPSADREARLVAQYEARLCDAMQRIAAADKRTMVIYGKYRGTFNALRSAGDERKKQRRMLLRWKAAMRQAREEVDAVRTNYGEQLRVLTEHAAGLAAKLEEQQQKAGGH